MNTPIRIAVRSSPDYPFVPVEAAVKLDQNEAAEDLPAALKALVLERLAAEPWHRYPDLNAEGLCRAIGEHAGWPASGVVVTTGSNVLISLLIQLAALEARVVTVTPNFALYGLDAKLLGARLTEVPLRADMSVDMPALVAALETGAGQPTGVVYLPRPHAPTGSLVPEDELERLVSASAGWLTVVDEAYHEFAGTEAIALARRFPHVLLMRTFSKAWGLAGLRLGYLLASDEVAGQLRKLVPPFAVSVLQTVATRVALAHPAFMRESVARTVAERDRVALALRAHPTWQVFPSSANFLLIRTPDAARAWHKLLAGGVLVRRQDAQPGLAGCLRVTIGTPAENDAFLRAAGVAV